MTYNTINPSRFRADLADMTKMPEYNSDGFFVFSDLRDGDYALNISGRRLQTIIHSFTIPFPELIIDSAGDDELIVVIKSINGNNAVTFDPVILNREIRAGARVIANGFSTHLKSELAIGKRSQANLDDTAGLADGDIVRIIRDKSLRMKFDPYYEFPFKVTRVVGRVVTDGLSTPLKDAEIRLTKVNDTDVLLTDVEGVKVATVEIGGGKIILGAEKDVTAKTNSNGDYNAYFDAGKFIEDNTETDLLQKIALEAALDGFQSASGESQIKTGERKVINFELSKA